MNLVAYSYGLNNVNAGDEILVSIMEHHSNLLPWQMVARQTGAVLRFIECRTDGSVDLDQVKMISRADLAPIKSRTPFLAFSYSSVASTLSG